MADDDENFAPLQSSEEIVGEMSFSQIKAELKREDYQRKGGKQLLLRVLSMFPNKKNRNLRVRMKVLNRLLQSKRKPCQLTTGLQSQLVTIYRRSLLVIS